MYEYVLSERYTAAPPFQADSARLLRWAQREEDHLMTRNWQPVNENDEPQPQRDDVPCPYTERVLAALAVKWVVTSAFSSAERAEHEPVRFVDSVLFHGGPDAWDRYLVDYHVGPTLVVRTHFTTPHKDSYTVTHTHTRTFC
jgi:hypothetical protein